MTESELRQRIERIVPASGIHAQYQDTLKAEIFNLVKEQGTLEPDPQPKKWTVGQEFAHRFINRCHENVRVSSPDAPGFYEFTVPGTDVQTAVEIVRDAVADLIDAGTKAEKEKSDDILRQAIGDFARMNDKNRAEIADTRHKLELVTAGRDHAVQDEVKWQQECQRIEEAAVELHKKIDAMERDNAQLKQERDDFRTAYLAINRIVDRR